MNELIDTREGLEHLMNRVHRCGKAGLDTESSGPLLIATQFTKAGNRKYKDFINMYASTTTGWSIALPDGEAYYVPLSHRKGNAPYKLGVDALRRTLSSSATLYIHNLQHELLAFSRLGINTTPSTNLRCTQVAAFLAQLAAVGAAPYGLKPLALHHFGFEMSTFKETCGEHNFCELTPEQGLEYACEDAIAALMLGEKAEQVIHSWGLTDWYLQTELPFLWVLREMTDEGLPLDSGMALQLHEEFQAKAGPAAVEFERITGCSPRSPKQMQALFANGVWPKHRVHKTKTGFSTNGDSIDALVAFLDPDTTGYKAAKLLQDVRLYGKLVSTYTESLVRIADQYPDGRLHPGYNPTGAATGRLSSSYINAQNIPVRSEQGMRILELFHTQGHWGSCDFSQVDLRSCAHFSQGALAEVFRQGGDVHQSTADSVGSTRFQAKTINFAIIYGQMALSLSRGIGCTEGEAEIFMEEYARTYSDVVELSKQAKLRAYRRGYIKTLSGRRRLLPMMRRFDPSVTKMGWRAVGRGILEKEELLKLWSEERKCLNTVCQGTAADLMKQAMVDIYKAKPSHMKFQAQIHDDLRWRDDLAIDDTMHIVSEGMEKCWPGLRVPLVAEPIKAQSWRGFK